MAVYADRELLWPRLVWPPPHPLSLPSTNTTERIILVSTLVIYILAGRVIFNLRGSLRRFAGSEESQRTPTGPTRDTLGTMSPSPPPTSPQPGDRPIVVNTLQSYSCTVSSGYTARTRNSGVEANTAAWAYCRCAMLFFLALVITWVRESPYHHIHVQ